MSQLPLLPKALGLAWQASPRWTALWAGLLVAQGTLPVAFVFLAKRLVDGMVELIGEDQGLDPEAARPVLLVFGAIVLVMVLTELLRVAAQYVRAVQAELVQDHLVDLIHRKSMEVDLAFYESASFFNHLHRARQGASTQTLSLLETTGTLAQNALTLLAMMAVLLPFGWWAAAGLLLSTVPALAVVMHHTFKRHRWSIATTERTRRTLYFDWLLTSEKTAAELRLFDLGERFRESYRALRRGLRGEQLGLVARQTVWEFGAALIGLAVTGGVLALMVMRTVEGVYTLGALAMFYQAFNQGQRLMRTQLAGMGQLYSNTLFLSHLFEFLGLEPGVDGGGDQEFRLEKGIEFKDVSFSYPGSDRGVFSRLSLFIPAGKTLALLGDNGAGKSTLFKLLCRFYDPQSGVIEIDGVDIRTMDPQILRRRLAVLFQVPVQFNMSVRENITLGDEGRDADADELERAARLAGADTFIGDLAAGYESTLGRIFSDGNELSVGQWQRIALARAFYRRSPVLLLDEPTSAMDSWSEADWIERLTDATEGRTVVVITHRLSTARHADRICVMRSGEIVESGTHQELLDQQGLYAQSWNELNAKA